MDAITDLSARTTAYIILIQQYCILNREAKPGAAEISMVNIAGKVKPSRSDLPIHPIMGEVPFQLSDPVYTYKIAKYEDFTNQVVSLVWINNHLAKEADVIERFANRAFAVVDWLWQDHMPFLLEEYGITEKPLPSPDQWRNAINKILYDRPDERVPLSRAISYIPIQIILASGGGTLNTLQQRILQDWRLEDPVKSTEIDVIAEGDIALLEAKNREILKQNTEDFKVLVKEKNHKDSWGNRQFESSKAINMLNNPDELLINLKQQNIPLPFEYILGDEVSEIYDSRVSRYNEAQIADDRNPIGSVDIADHYDHTQPPIDPRKTQDPILKAEQMGFYALSFSGGGIRSATFNLGILQAFAEAGHLSKFDYLSTVSGGGYVGSWLVSWIKREGSVLKVGNRLNSKKSSDPMADEVRPIRWLRMFSNYLSPNSSSMSTDAWTSGMTLLRNMLLNQLIIIFLLFTVTLLGKLILMLWLNKDLSIGYEAILCISSVLILSGALLAGYGMRLYHSKSTAELFPDLPGKTKITVSDGLLLLSCVFSLFTSSYFFNHSPEILPIFKLAEDTHSFGYLLSAVLPFGIVSLAGLLLVAIMGKYVHCASSETFSARTKSGLILLFSTIAAFLGMVLLAVVWRLLHYLGTELIYICVHDNKVFVNHLLGFTFGFPLVLEVLSFTVVMRMGLLGKFFPDERREWWGRMGGLVHKICFLWILIFGTALFGGTLLGKIADLGISAVITAGGWGTVVLGSVKAAFSPKSSADGKPSLLASALDLLSRIGPYLFLLGLLIFLPVLLGKILVYIPIPNQIGYTALAMVATGLITWFLGNRVGVNEFSMHHFYKNRLVRAYLGATRDRMQRKKTASSFTGFDKLDDLPLSEIVNKKGYYGPYPILNTALNASYVSELDRQDRMAESFIFSPLFCGFDFSRTRSSASTQQKNYDYAYRPTAEYAYPDKGAHIGSAMAISGAAANPNMGYHSSPATAFMLTVFNVRLGWWIGNPRKSKWRQSDPELGLPYLLSDLAGKSDTNDDFVCLSDGGHFDNMGLYELIRRRTKVIVLGDGEQDEKFICEGLANAIRRCRIDFGVEININVSQITDLNNGFSAASYAIGTINYPGKNQFTGTLIYLKASMCGIQPVDVREYALKNKTFPHQSTGDQFFNEEQFESYRKLGYEIAQTALSNIAVTDIFKVSQHNLRHLWR